MTNVNKIIREKARKKLEDLLLAGNFKEVEYSKTDEGFIKSTKYNMMKYILLNARYMKLLDSKLKAYYPDGIFSRKRDKQFISISEQVINAITVNEIEAQTERFKTMMG